MSTGSEVPGSRARVNGVRIAYRDVGNGEPLVLVHGSWGSLHNWDAVVARLAEHYRVISYDRRGHSESERVAGQGTFAEDVADLAALVEALDAAPAWVVGNSVGAIITLRLAAARPDLVRGVIVHEPPLRSLLSEGGADGPLRVVLDLIRAGEHAAAAERFVDDVALGPGAWARLPTLMRATMIGNATTYLDEELASDSRIVDEAALARYAGPVLISSGGQSPPIFQPMVRHLARLLPQAQCVEYAGAGHVPHVTHPEAFVHQVTTFTSRVNRQTSSCRHPDLDGSPRREESGMLVRFCATRGGDTEAVTTVQCDSVARDPTHDDWTTPATACVWGAGGGRTHRSEPMTTDSAAAPVECLTSRPQLHVGSSATPDRVGRHIGGMGSSWPLH